MADTSDKVKGGIDKAADKAKEATDKTADAASKNQRGPPALWTVAAWRSSYTLAASRSRHRIFGLQISPTLRVDGLARC